MGMLPVLLYHALRYLPGEPVPTLRRTQHSGQRTAWHEVPHGVAPRFLAESSVLISALPEDAVAAEPFKLSFAFDGLQQVTPWITVSDGKGRFLSHLTLSLTAAGDALTAVRWQAAYIDGEVPPEHVHLKTVWEDAIEHDLSVALQVLFLVAAALALGLGYTTCARNRETVARMLTEDDEGGEEPLHPYRRQELSYREHEHRAAGRGGNDYYDGRHRHSQGTKHE